MKWGTIFILCSLVSKIKCQCTFTHELTGSWKSSNFGTITITNVDSEHATLALESHSFRINGKTTSVYDCYKNSGSVYVLRSQSEFDLLQETGNAYICFHFHSANAYSYYFYMKSPVNNIFGNERVSFWGNTQALPSLSAVCSESPSTAEFNSMIKTGFENSSRTNCMDHLLGNFYYTASTSAVTDDCSGSGNSLLTVCDNRQVMVFDTQLCTTITELFSANGVLFCISVIEGTDGTYYSGLYNYDTSVNGLTTFQFTCIAVTSDTRGVKMTASPNRCVASQSSSSLPASGQKYVMTDIKTCPFTSEEDSTNVAGIVLGVIFGIIGIVILIVIIILLYRYCIRRKRRADEKARIKRNLKTFQRDMRVRDDFVYQTDFDHYTKSKTGQKNKLKQSEIPILFAEKPTNMRELSATQIQPEFVESSRGMPMQKIKSFPSMAETKFDDSEYYHQGRRKRMPKVRSLPSMADSMSVENYEDPDYRFSGSSSRRPIPKVSSRSYLAETGSGYYDEPVYNFLGKYSGSSSRRPMPKNRSYPNVTGSRNDEYIDEPELKFSGRSSRHSSRRPLSSSSSMYDLSRPPTRMLEMKKLLRSQENLNKIQHEGKSYSKYSKVKGNSFSNTSSRRPSADSLESISQDSSLSWLRTISEKTERLPTPIQIKPGKPKIPTRPVSGLKPKVKKKSALQKAANIYGVSQSKKKSKVDIPTVLQPIFYPLKQENQRRRKRKDRRRRFDVEMPPEMNPSRTHSLRSHKNAKVEPSKAHNERAWMYQNFTTQYHKGHQPFTTFDRENFMDAERVNVKLMKKKTPRRGFIQRLRRKRILSEDSGISDGEST